MLLNVNISLTCQRVIWLGFPIQDLAWLSDFTKNGRCLTDQPSDKAHVPKARVTSKLLDEPPGSEKGRSPCSGDDESTVIISHDVGNRYKQHNTSFKDAADMSDISYTS